MALIFFAEGIRVKKVIWITIKKIKHLYNVSVLGREEGYMVKYNPLPEGVPEGEARGYS